ncbi:MAG: phage tail spike protein [Paraclostridium sp.]|uniref:phage tail spike protein n=1 Tax=Paraclostridium sp. TaxID=2023273 RepID=UPI003EE78302
MIPILYDKTGKVKLGELVDIIDSGYVEEERNGIFEFTIDYPVGYPLSDLIVEENMIETKPNEEQDLQKFRIYDTKRLMKNIITVFARHESFDLANDHVENVNLENASCEYALNTLFRNSHFSTHYRGYSDIINAQNYSIDNVNILNAIAGKEGSIIDTYGTGAEILRDGTNIHVLNKRGHDNEVTIEFGKNLTDFVLERDLTDLETRVGGFAKYTPEGGKETIVKSNWIDSPYIDNFAHPYINIEGRRDYSDKFKNGEIPTVEKLDKLCEDEFKINKRDIPKSNYTIKFIPLSKCVGYEGLQDKISLCDTARIIDKRFNVDTKAKVIKYKYDFIKERYESMELGKPRTTLGDIIGGGGTQGSPGKDGPPGKDGADGNIGDFPDSLPNTPILTANVKGWGSIDLSWTFEDKVYYTYELYASKTKDFKPNIFDLIHSGQSSSHLFQAKPGETWYFRICAKNTHESRTEFSPQVAITTKKSDDFEEYFSTLGVGNLVANIFSADYMEAGIIKGNWIDMRHLTLTDGNGKRVFDCDDFGRLYADFSEFTINGSAVAQEDWVKTKISNSADGLKQEVSNEYATKTEVTQAVDKWKVDFATPTSNKVVNSIWNKSFVGWFRNGTFVYDCFGSYTWINHDRNTLWIKNDSNQFHGLFQPIKFTPGKTYTLFLKYQNDGGYITGAGTLQFGIENLSVQNRSLLVADGWHTERITFTATQTEHTLILYMAHAAIYAEYMQIVEGNPENTPPWTPHANEVINSGTEITEAGILVKNGAIRIRNQSEYDVFWVDQHGNLCTDNIYIYGAEKEANLEIGGTGNKGIGIRSSSGGDRYIDFCTTPKGSSYQQNVDSGTFTRLYANEGDFYIMPTSRLIIQSNQKPRLDRMDILVQEFWVGGNINTNHSLIAEDAVKCRNISHPEGGAGNVINVDAKLNLIGGTTFSAGVFASAPMSLMFFRTLSEKPLDILDSIEFIDKTKMPRFNSLIALPNEEEAIQEENTELLMDVSNIVGTPYASIDEKGSAIASYEELLKLALKEIKELKNEVSILKEKVGA